MYIQGKNYNKLNEVLYVLNSVSETTYKSASKIALQKLLYLSACLAPIKDVILAYIRFNRIQRGPYSSEIQNTVDHLVACGLVEIVTARITHSKNSLAYYKISDGGKIAVKTLTKYSVEEEKYWWINCIVKLSEVFSKDKNLPKEGDYDGLDKIVYLVYQDRTFKEAKETGYFRTLIDFGYAEGETSHIITSIKKFLKESSFNHSKLNERTQAEMILLTFFEQYLANIIDVADERSK